MFSRTRVKICGFTRAQDIDAAVQLGADRRQEAVGADQNGAAFLAAVLEPRRHAGPVLLEADAAMAGLDEVAGQPVHQHPHGQFGDRLRAGGR